MTSQPSRPVRVSEEFWISLEIALATDEGPSWHAFASHDLPEAVEAIAATWDELPTYIQGRTDYRLLIRAGRTVFSYVIEAQLTRDGAIELLAIDIDLSGPDPAQD